MTQTRRGFLISLLMFPLWIVIGAVVPQWIEKSTPTRAFTVLDRGSGAYAFALAKAVQADQTRGEFEALASYAERHIDRAKLEREAPHLARLLDSPPGDAKALEDFRRIGGLTTLRAQLEPFRIGSETFTPPRPRFRFVPPRSTLAHLHGDSFAEAVKAELTGENPLYAVVVIPANFSAASEAEFWSLNASDPELQRFIRTGLSDGLRDAALSRYAPDLSPDLLLPTARLRNLDPGARQDSHELSSADKARSYMPAALAFLLLLTVFMNAGALLSGVIEEKSSRIVEVILSCVTPIQFMTGKLLGAAAASLLTLFLWGAMLAAGAAFFVPGALALIGGLLMSLLATGLLPMLLLCFTCGLLIYASIFLAIGSMATSIQDAQALVGPAMILVMAPLIMMPALLGDPNGPIATGLSWIPIYTPFFMMFRLPWDPPLFEVVGASLLMIATTIFLVIQMGRIFAAHVLTTERPPKLRNLFKTKSPPREDARRAS